jgi:ribosomal subunit interface protein
MQLTVQGKQMDVGDALRTHVTERIEDINRKFFNHATDATVTFSKEGHGHGVVRSHVQIRIGRNITVMADAEAGDAYGAFEKTAEKVTTQMRRYKNRLRTHHDKMQAAESEILHARDFVIAEDEDEAHDDKGTAPAIIAEMTTPIQTMTVSEAVMRMDLAHQNALLFRNASHGELNLVYRRPDGNVGWVDPGLALKKPANSSKKPAAKSKSKATAKPKAKAKVKVKAKPKAAAKPKAGKAKAKPKLKAVPKPKAKVKKRA